MEPVVEGLAAAKFPCLSIAAGIGIVATTIALATQPWADVAISIGEEVSALAANLIVLEAAGSRRGRARACHQFGELRRWREVFIPWPSSR